MQSPLNGIPRRPLLGTVDWQRPDWVTDYYPPDIPEDWRLAYYANDADCVLVPAHVLNRFPGAEMTAQLDEAPNHLVFFLQAPGTGAAADGSWFEPFRDRRSIVLAESSGQCPQGMPVWTAGGDGRWVEPLSGRSAQVWDLAGFDLKDLRHRAEAQASEPTALLLDGPAASPTRIHALRTLLDLLRVA